MIVGIFAPTLYRTGGGELVTVNIVNTLKKEGYKTTLSTMRKVNQAKIVSTFGKNLNFDTQIVFPFHIFPPYSLYSLHTIALQSYVLRLKCDVFIDTYSYSLFPWADIVYFQGRHFVDFSKLEGITSKKKKIFLLSYYFLLNSLDKHSKLKILLANSKFTAGIINKYVYPNLSNVSTYVLYPPVDTNYFSLNKMKLTSFKKNSVIALSRITPEKELQTIPYIAKMTNKNIRFIIAGSCQSYKCLYEIERAIKKYHVSDRVKILTNLTRAQVRNLLWESKVYLHTAKNEPFGITIVEAMASGCIPIVHDSGGPMEFVPQNYRYKTLEEAAKKTENALSEWSIEKCSDMINIANIFNEKEFSRNFLKILNSNIHKFA